MKWTVGEYEDDPEMGFIGQLGGSVCFVDEIPKCKALIIVAAHNAEIPSETHIENCYEIFGLMEHGGEEVTVNLQPEIAKLIHDLARVTAERDELKMKSLEQNALILHLQLVLAELEERHPEEKQFILDMVYSEDVAIRPSGDGCE
ncbi:MAG: hypothetical protein DRJ03_01400 [Chloroflexi bacterium]|nr:MAG: hypothetical protein DRJ03_01400 [Chloroflexota bacterium]